MQNFSEKDVMDRLQTLENALASGGIISRIIAIESDIQKLMQEVFQTAGIGAAQATGTTVNAIELAATQVGVFKLSPEPPITVQPVKS